MISWAGVTCKRSSLESSGRWRLSPLHHFDFSGIDRGSHADSYTMFCRSALRLGSRHTAPRSCLRASRPIALPVRSYASLSPDTPPPTKPYEVFDEDGKTRQKDRAILRLQEQQDAGELEDPQVLDYIREEVADRITERIEVSCSRTLQPLMSGPEDAPGGHCRALVARGAAHADASGGARRQAAPFHRGSGRRRSGEAEVDHGGAVRGGAEP